MLSTHFEPSHAIRVGWLSPGDLTEVEEVVDLPSALSPVKVADDGTTITQLGRGALAVTHTTTSGTEVRALTCHLKSKLLSFPGGRFDTDDETERARYAVYALDRRAAEAAAIRDWATTALAGDWADRPVLVCGDLNDTPEAATTQLLFGPPGSQIGTGGFSHPDQGDPAASVGHRLRDAAARRLLPDQPGPPRAHRPHPGLPRIDRAPFRTPPPSRWTSPRSAPTRRSHPAPHHRPTTDRWWPASTSDPRPVDRSGWRKGRCQPAVDQGDGVDIHRAV